MKQPNRLMIILASIILAPFYSVLSTTALGQNLKAPEEYFRRGLQRINKRDPEGAFQDFSQVIDLMSHPYKSSNSSEAEAGQRIRVIDPRLAVVFNNRGVSLFLQKQFSAAIVDFDTALSLNPRLPEAWHNRGNAKRESGRPAEALRDFQRALELDPRNAGTWLLEGMIRFELNQFQAALTDLDTSISLSSKQTEAFNTRGLVLHRLGRLTAALEDFQQALRLDANSVAALNNRGNLYKSLGQYAAAKADFDRAVQLDPRQPEIWNNRAGLKAAEGDLQGALEDYHQAVYLKPSALILTNRGLIYQALTQYAAAIADYDEALKTDPDFEMARTCRQRLLEVLSRRKFQKEISESTGSSRITLPAISPDCLISP